MKVSSTKERIIDTAITLFSDRGYEKVSMRDIAGTVGIKASSIYNHFLSKQDILKSVYESYAKERNPVFPDIEDVLCRLETRPIDEVLNMMSYHWPPRIQDKMDRIIMIASQRILLDKKSEDFIEEHFFKPLSDNWVQLLNRGIELGKIAAVDIESFIKIITFYAFCAAELNRTAMRITLEQWNSGLKMLYSLLKPEKEAHKTKDEKRDKKGRYQYV